MNLYEVWKNRSKAENDSSKKFLARLNKSKNKRLNHLADQLHEKTFERLDCLDCANCCKSIPPIINEMDVKRASKFMGMKAVDFKEKFIRIDEDLDMVINSSPCPFLEPDNSCLIYEGRPRACREYPHTDNFEFLKNIKLHKINIDYCPAVYTIVREMKEKT